MQGCALALLSVGGAFALVQATGWTALVDVGIASPYFIAFDVAVVVALQQGWSPEDTPLWGFTSLTLAGALGAAAILAWS